MGKGTFLIEIVDRLMYIYGYTEKDAKSRVYGYDIRVKYINYLQRQGFINLRHKDFLSEIIKMKFDAIVGNPPYQSGNNKSNKLWVKFISKSFELSENLCFVVPLSLLTSESKQITDIRKKLSNKKNIFNLTKKDIFNVGEKVVYFTSINSNLIESIIVFSDTVIKKVNNLINRQPVEINDDIKLLIFNKIENFPYKNEYVYDFNPNSNKTTPKRLIKEGLVSEIKDDEVFKYKVHHSASKILYSRVLISSYSKNNESTYGKLKVVLNYSGGFVGERYMFLSTDLVGKQMFGILVDNEIEGNNLINLYSSKLFNWYINAEKSGGFNTGIFKLPKMDITKLWSDSEIYDFFELTQDEINYIESYGI
jgi:site-specific DNA-methyltransferase (adenine-specific)